MNQVSAHPQVHKCINIHIVCTNRMFTIIIEPQACYGRVTETNSTNNNPGGTDTDSDGGCSKLHGSLLKALMITTLVLVVLK